MFPARCQRQQRKIDVLTMSKKDLSKLSRQQGVLCYYVWRGSYLASAKSPFIPFASYRRLAQLIETKCSVAGRTI